MRADDVVLSVADRRSEYVQSCGRSQGFALHDLLHFRARMSLGLSHNLFQSAARQVLGVGILCSTMIGARCYGGQAELTSPGVIWSSLDVGAGSMVSRRSLDGSR